MCEGEGEMEVKKEVVHNDTTSGSPDRTCSSRSEGGDEDVRMATTTNKT